MKPSTPVWSVSGFTTLPVFSLPQPPACQAQTPIGELRRHEDTTIRGTIRSVVGNEFILSDGTGEIIVDAGPLWYRQLDLRVGEEVTVLGEYDDYDFDAFRITYSNGEVIQIREGNGPPPWSDGRRDRR
jgi:hypothetical protein